MPKALNSSLFILAGMATFWAYTIMDTLIRDFKLNVTVIDLVGIFILGLITGVALGVTCTRNRIQNSQKQ